MTESERLLWIALVMVAWLALVLVCRRPRLQGGASSGDAGAAAECVLVAWASQGGTAERWARHSAAALEPHCPVRLLPLDAVDEQVLRTTRRAVIVASTYGEGEPPDNGVRFQQRYLREPTGYDLSHLEFAVLALGDRAYQQFCAFGRRLQVGLEQLGARPMAGLVEVDSSMMSDPRHWPNEWNDALQRLLPAPASAASGSLSTDLASPATVAVSTGYSAPLVSTASAPAPPRPRCVHWLLAGRELMNAGSPGAPLYRLHLTPVADVPVWRAGDIVTVQPRNSDERCRAFLDAVHLDGTRVVSLDGVMRPLASWVADRRLPDLSDPRAVERLSGSPEHWLDELPLLPRREYSVASVPAEGSLQLMVRLQRYPCGEPGIGSGWLTRHVREGAIIATRLRHNPAFHGPEPERPVILVGAGSGLAGLRAHLVERALGSGCGPNWLLFGERTRHSDSLLDAELRGWLASGHLSRLDRVFSRDVAQGSGEPRHVQELLSRHAEDVRLWVAEGAAILVCGSFQGMGQGVQQALVEILGSDTLARLQATGLFKRDLY